MSTPPPTAPTPASAKNDATPLEWVVGVVLSVTLPLVGVIIGLVYIGRGGQKRHFGWACVALACASVAIFMATLSGRLFVLVVVEDPDPEGGGPHARHLDDVGPLHRRPAQALDALGAG